jgi:hypothetical protein
MRLVALFGSPPKKSPLLEISIKRRDTHRERERRCGDYCKFRYREKERKEHKKTNSKWRHTSASVIQLVALGRTDNDCLHYSFTNRILKLKCCINCEEENGHSKCTE